MLALKNPIKVGRPASKYSTQLPASKKPLIRLPSWSMTPCDGRATGKASELRCKEVDVALEESGGVDMLGKTLDGQLCWGNGHLKSS